MAACVVLFSNGSLILVYACTRALLLKQTQVEWEEVKLTMKENLMVIEEVFLLTVSEAIIVNSFVLLMSFLLRYSL